MKSINEYFPPEGDGWGDGWGDHPRLRHWKELLHRGAQLDLEVRRERRGLDVEPPVLCITIEADGPRRLETEPWSDDLHRGLLKLGMRAISDDNESLRFGIAFADAFEPAENYVGDGFFNAVLIEALKQGPLAERLAEQLQQIHVLTPNRDGSSYADCRALIVGAIQGRARELTHDLEYEKPQANTILAGALAIYLDDRFSITERRQLGWA